jgi:signal transduction histidine kinase
VDDPAGREASRNGPGLDSEAAHGSGDNVTPCEQAQDGTNRKLRSLLELGRLIGLDLQVDEILLRIAEKATEVMEADRFTIFLYDAATGELWSKVALGMGDREIRVPVHTGIAGYSFRTGETLRLDDARNDSRFTRAIDDETGYVTKSLLSMPFYGRSGSPMGVIQLLNKREGVFSDEDETFLRTFNNHAAVFIEMAQLQKARIDALEQAKGEAERLGRAKGKALDHLAHELRTPLALIRGTLKLLKRRVEGQMPPETVQRFFENMERFLSRLSSIQQETDKILRTYHDMEISFVVEEIERLIGTMSEKAAVPGETIEHWNALKRWMIESFTPSARFVEEIDLAVLLEERITAAREKSAHRDLTITLDGALGMRLTMDRDILTAVLDGILKNAIENTPDGGLVKVAALSDERELRIGIEDFGVGITDENRQRIFDGLFHAQDTDAYGSKKPYEFNAGGKGLELLLAKVYGKKYGFAIDLDTKRCAYIPRETDLCAGAIAACPFCKTQADCLASGGSTFTIIFPVRQVARVGGELRSSG